MPKSLNCCLCKTSQVDILNLGEMKSCRMKNSGKSLHAHYYCLLLASTITQSGKDNEGILGFLVIDMKAEIRRAKKRVCYYCKKNGATIICNSRFCQIVFHLPCGLNNNSGHQFYGKFISHCASHRIKQKFTLPKEPKCCPICYDLIPTNNKLKILWAPCCKKNSYFHKTCIQQMALSAGYFFRCPICNNTSVFQRTMKQFGVFIPDRDASWELVPNAFEELLYRHEECNAKVCQCVDGRLHNGVEGWAIILCNNCGSQGTHMICSNIKKNETWVCSDCTIISTVDVTNQVNEIQNLNNLNLTSEMHQPSTSNIYVHNASNDILNVVTNNTDINDRKRKLDSSFSGELEIAEHHPTSTDSDSDVEILSVVNGNFCNHLPVNHTQDENVHGHRLKKRSRKDNNAVMNIVIKDVRSLLDSPQSFKNSSTVATEECTNENVDESNRYLLYSQDFNSLQIYSESNGDICVFQMYNINSSENQLQSTADDYDPESEIIIVD